MFRIRIKLIERADARLLSPEVFAKMDSCD